MGSFYQPRAPDTAQWWQWAFTQRNSFISHYTSGPSSKSGTRREAILRKQAGLAWRPANMTVVYRELSLIADWFSGAMKLLSFLPVCTSTSAPTALAITSYTTTLLDAFNPVQRHLNSLLSLPVVPPVCWTDRHKDRPAHAQQSCF